MKKLYILLYIVVFLAGVKAQDSNRVYLIFDEPCSDSLPSAFRKMNGVFRLSATSMPSVSGLASLNASGSAQFCERSLKAVIKEINFKKIIVVDLRQESHGFVNGMSLSWFGKYDWANVGLSRDQVEVREDFRLDSLESEKYIKVTRFTKRDPVTYNPVEMETVKVEVQKTYVEEEFTEDYKLGYFRITVTNHRMPSIDDVDRFLKFARSLRNTWLHFHGGAGAGRVTTFLAMYDMMRNAKKVSLDDILLRQYLLGGINLAKDDDLPEWDKSYATARTKFLKSFYDYCKTDQNGFNTVYSEWLKK
jgi:inositol hexakisphosphate